MDEENIYNQNNITLSIGMKFGCLEIIDDDDEYLQWLDSRISSIEDEKSKFLYSIQNGELKHDDWHGWGGNHEIITPAYIYDPKNFETHNRSITIADFDNAVTQLIKQKETKRYKCKCGKCGKIRYYSQQTLQTNPLFCFYPIYCTSKFTYSVKSVNATYRKRKRYENVESVYLVGEKDKVVPSDEYCTKWNEKREKELRKQAEKEAAEIAALPRKYAKNYDLDYVGLKYESLEVLECINGYLESVPVPYFNQRHQKLYRDITVFKQYRCRCYLCGKEQIVTCDKFGIYPPTKYGYRAYDGYWSDILCDCHETSSFQWIVNKLLIENNVPYQVEYSFSDLYGIYEKNHLRFDFAILNNDGSVSCLIECQGEQHYKPVEKFGGEEQYKVQVKNDNLKRAYTKEHNITLLEISYKDKRFEKVESILRQYDII